MQNYEIETSFMKEYSTQQGKSMGQRAESMGFILLCSGL